MLSVAGSLLIVYVVCIPGIKGRTNSICALKGSSVNLSCSAPHPAPNVKWYIVYMNGQEYVYYNLSAHENPGRFRLSEDGLTLTIRDLTERDGKLYCCSETTPRQESCQQNSYQLQVTDLQVKVFPATEGQKVTLICTHSCPLTESPSAFIWYKNREFFYEDWSHWYQELVSNDPTVRYSCAIKGYEDLRAPEVSVDSVTRSCFSVTYAEGRMCSYKQKSEIRSCSITFPTEVHLQMIKIDENHIKISCNSSCSLTDLQTSFQLFRNTASGLKKINQISVVGNTSIDRFTCTVKDFDDLLSNDVCVERKICWSVNYDSRRICALKGSSVNISSKYSHPKLQQLVAKLWYKGEINRKQEDEQLMEDKGDVTYQDNMENQHILTLNHLNKNNTGEYKFRMKTESGKQKSSDLPGVTLIVTELLVDVKPAAEVTEGQRVTLMCSTSCPVSQNTNYVWYLNNQPLDLTETANKRLIIDAVSSQDEGNYSCTVEMISSAVKTLTVHRRRANWKLAAAGCAFAVLVVLFLIVFFYRKNKTSPLPSRSESINNAKETNIAHTYEEISAQSPQEELHYSQLAMEKLNPLYSSFEQDQEERDPYAVVKIK